MRKGVRQKRKCIHCDDGVVEYYYGGRFKGYRKTCERHCDYGMRRGALAKNWKGGRVKRQGYVYLLDESRYEKRGFSRYKAEHQIIAEAKYGRKINKDELVHHLNGVRDDNRPENLVIIKRKGHETWTYAKTLQERIRQLEELCQKLQSRER